jgi:hypothetical protein
MRDLALSEFIGHPTRACRRPERTVAELFVNPKLPNYFVAAPEVTSADTARSYVDEFEHAKVVHFPNLKAKIDHDFWAGLDTNKYLGLRKFGAVLCGDIARDAKQHREALLKREVPEALAGQLYDQFQAIYEALLPAYHAIFAGYRFAKQKVVWRLNTTMNENMHLDVYDDEKKEHFARMFINLDNQPRIWQTSWTVDEILEKLDGKIPASFIEENPRSELWRELALKLFGRHPSEWWDNQPRHVAYFAPGDVWIVDSRQVAHQIFYGRRALSIDFAVHSDSMHDGDRQYLKFVDRFRARNL